MADPTSTGAEVLASRALEPAPQVVWQADVTRTYRTIVRMVAVFLLNQALGKNYLSLWSAQLGFLTDVALAIERAEPADEAIARLEQGLRDLAETVDRTARQVAQLPTAPPGGLALLFLAPAIRADPTSRDEFNATLEEWEDTAREATEHTRALVEAARRFSAEMPDQITALRVAIQDSSGDKVLDDVLKARYRQRLDLLELAVTRDVVPAVQKAEQADRHSRISWTAARDTERLRGD